MKNFEKYKTSEERTKAFEKFCSSHRCIGCSLVFGIIHCIMQWLDEEAKEEAKDEDNND